ncbi:MAG: glycoside hydrolase family 9 protein [Ruminococcus sp.]
MVKKKINKIKSAVLSGMMAITAIAAPVSSSVAPTITADAAGSDNYAKLLQYSLYFYDTNMCGSQVNDTSKITWRGNCHTGDDAVGGFHDAGDHAMFGLPQGYTASTLGWSYYEFKDAFNSTGQGGHLKVITNYFCDFFKKSTKLDGSGNVQSFLYQKGDGNEDHSYWGAPELQSNSRRQYWTSNSASDIAAEYAAALAVNYINFGNAEDLKYAEALYKFSTQHNSIATDGPTGFYNNSSCRDEQAWAAGWLYLATKNESYKNDCASKQNQYLGWVHGWENVDLGAACVYAYITGDWSKVNGWIGSQTNSSGYYFLDQWGSARYNCSLQFTALVASKNSNADYSSWCKGQMNYILGDNPKNTCFVTGFASNSAKNAHHRAASGYQGYEGSDGMNEYTTTYHPTKGHVLIGALVGGPSDASGTYSDVMNDYKCNEVAIDYNAGLVGAAAALYSVYKTGTPDTSIEGVSDVYNSSAEGNQPQQPTTEPPTSPQQPTTSPQQPTTNPPSGNAGEYEMTVGESYDYGSMTEKMIGWKWADLGIPVNEKVQKVEVTISSNNNIGKWQGAFGTSTKVAPDYWAQSSDMEQTISGNKGTITWNVDSDTADIIQYQYDGELKFGVWWIECQQFKVESVKVYTDGTSVQQPTTQKPTQAPTTVPTTPIPAIWGDADLDGEPTINDVVMVMCYASGKSTQLSDEALNNCDVYNRGDGVNASDAVTIQKYLAKLITSLPET